VLEDALNPVVGLAEAHQVLISAVPVRPPKPQNVYGLEQVGLALGVWTDYEVAALSEFHLDVGEAAEIGEPESLDVQITTPPGLDLRYSCSANLNGITRQR
jgi:hypothetical protein